MKTIQYTAAITLALLLGTNALQAQSTRRNAAQERKERVTATRQTERVAHQNKPNQAARTQVTQAERRQVSKPNQAARTQVTQAERRQVTQTPRHIQSGREVRKTEVRKPEVRNPQVRPERRPVSISNNKNPRSTYRKPESRLIVAPPRNADTRVNKYSSKRYYGGKYYHNAYPRKNVSIHYHYDTYVNHYHALYYPSYTNIHWTRSMYRDYRRWYPNYHWSYRYGYRIQTISVFDARYNLGEVAMVYGRVYASWYNQETDDFLLFFGGDYPRHQFTVVLPGNVARRFSWRPERYFLGEHITVTGLITTFDGIPEIIVKNKSQVGLY